jgi:hypothetical protein
MEKLAPDNKILVATKLYTAAGAPQQIEGFVLPSHNRFARKFRTWQKCPGRPHTAGRYCPS